MLSEFDFNYLLQHVTQACSLALLCALIFLRIHILLKVLTNFIILICYSWYIWSANQDLYMVTPNYN